ncbi:hypothetical protein Syun_019328 [Stephania yunnanensis]|uniref:Uncharacterized protein n=1 Tax=Stephania yunnanensis TaxID=152371 RepID=A0AAP0IWC0_9MAGN
MKLLNSMDSQVHKSFIASTIPLEDKNAKLGQPLSQLKHCKESNIRAEKSSNILVNDGTFSESGIPTSCDAGKLVSVNKTVNTGQDEDLDSDNSSDDTADAWGDGSAISQVFSLIKMNKQKNIRWQYESDMLSSLEEDPDLCLTAVCALYRQQGFSTFDVRRGNMLAEFLMGGTGNNAGGLKKSVKDLQMHNPKGLEQCKDLAMRHSSQLFNIYKKRRNPFFL